MSDDLKKIVKENLDSVKSISLFQGLQAKDLVKFLVKCQYSELEAGDILFKEGEPSTSMVIVLKGQLDIYKEEKKVCTLEAPDLVGEIGLFSESKRNATVKVAHKAVCLSITQNNISTFFPKLPAMSQNIFRNIILSMRNKINNDNQQILNFQEDLHEKEEEILQLKELLKENELLKDDNPPSNKRKDILPLEERLSQNDRKNIRVAITNQKHCYLEVDNSTVHVIDLSLGGIRVDLNSVKEEIRKYWVEGRNIRGKIFLQNENSFSFSGVIMNVYPNSCGIQFCKCTYTQESAIIKTVNDLQRLGQVV